jgi:hypothetical protein
MVWRWVELQDRGTRIIQGDDCGTSCFDIIRPSLLLCELSSVQCESELSSRHHIVPRNSVPQISHFVRVMRRTETIITVPAQRGNMSTCSPSGGLLALTSINPHDFPSLACLPNYPTNRRATHIAPNAVMVNNSPDRSPTSLGFPRDSNGAGRRLTKAPLTCRKARLLG